MTTQQMEIGSFEVFFETAEPRLRRALAARLGPEAGTEATSAAMEYAWKHWSRVQGMSNPAGYLYRVGLHSVPRRRPTPGIFPTVDQARWPWVEPRLPRALVRLSSRQRTVVVLRHCFDWTHTEIGELLGISKGSVQTHEQRGLAKLRGALGVEGT